MSEFDELTTDIRDLDDSELRSHVFYVAADGPDPGQAYGHQREALRRIEMGSRSTPPISGILHYPTGAGKTRVALEFIARALHEDPRHRFVWATDRKQLVRQSMLRLAELSRLFPKDTSFGWAKGADDVEDSDDDINVFFMTRKTLTNVLDRAGDGRRSHPWRQRLEARQPMTLVYDECHQLGADQLQRSWYKFHESVVAPGRARRPWRTIGLSATPVPTSPDAHGLLAECIFPLRTDGPSTNMDWPFHVYHRVHNDTLVASGVLCPINLYLDQKGDFDIPPELLRQVVDDAHLRPLGPNADPVLVQQYALQFNKRVLGDARVIAFLAERIGRNIETLGKTIVFAPNIDAANRFAAELYDRFPNLRGFVAAVHNKVEELRPPNQQRATANEVINHFRSLGDRPSVLVNVDMLTEGFDDPKINTVVLARLTLSTNRFWQMIGRGTRGPAVFGTKSCLVIDPVKLVRLYDYFSGYQPTFTKGSRVVANEEDEDNEPGAGGLAPEVGAVSLPPDPGSVTYEIDPELARVHAQVAAALRHFLDGAGLSESAALDAARNVSVDVAGGRPVFRPAKSGFHTDTALAIVQGEVAALERRAGVDLAWFLRQLPSDVDEPLLAQRLRALRAIETLSLWTESAFASAQMSGAFLEQMRREAQPVAAPSHAAEVQSAPALQFGPAEAAVVDAALAMTATDRKLTPAETSVVMETLRRMFGRAPSEELAAALDRRSTKAVPFDQLDANLDPAQRQLLLLQLAELAAADGVVTDGERQALDDLASRISIPPGVVEAVLGGHLARSDVRTTQAVASRSCPSCSFATPDGSRFCPSCGTPLPGGSPPSEALQVPSATMGPAPVHGYKVMCANGHWTYSANERPTVCKECRGPLSAT